MALAFYLVAVRGIGGLLQRWWRVLLLIMLVALTTISGYRSTPVLLGLVLALLFVFEGQFRSPRFLLIAFAGLIALAMLLPFTDQLPRPVQRSLTFLPVKVDPAIRRDAQGSTEWRVQMWQALVPDLPKYLWLGKGYALHPLDLYLTQEAMRRSLVPQYQGALVAGDYHSGPLSVYIPFGSFGALAFLVFLGVSIRALYRNYRYGDPEMRNINRFLLAYFCARAFFYLFAFGSFNMDLYQFTGIMGLSVALNHGVCRRPEAAVQPLPARVRKEIQMGGAEPSPA
jgi:O-antigen ligase